MPMTPFARKVLSDLPDRRRPARREQLRDAAAVREHHRQGERESRRHRRARTLALRSLRLPRRRHLRQPAVPSALGRQRQRRDLRHQQAVRAPAQRGRRRATSLLEVRFGWSDTIGGKNPPALGSTSALEAYGISGLPTDERVAGGLPTQLITGYADLGRQATNPQWQYPRVFNPKVNYSWVMAGTRSRAATSSSTCRPKCRTSTRSTVATPTRVSSRVPRRRRRRTISTTSPTSCSACAAVRAQQHPGGQSPPEHALPLRAGRLARERQAHAEPRFALRVRDAALGEGQHPVQLRSGRACDVSGDGTDRSKIVRRSSRTGTTAGRVSVSPGR